MTLDVFVGFGGVLVVVGILMTAWWLLGRAEQAEARKKREDVARYVEKLIKVEGEFEIKKMPFRNYLMEFVVPILNEGLLEVSNIIPDDPVELLAEYLYQKSYDV